MDTPIASILWFILILALIPGALWLLKRLQLVKGAQSGSARVVGVLPLSGSQRILTVEVGEGPQRRWLVLGVTPSSINLLHQMEPPTRSDADAAPPSFADALKRLGQAPGGQA